MPPRHLISHTNLTLLGYIDLGHLHDPRRQLIAHQYIEFPTLAHGIKLSILPYIVIHQPRYERILILIRSPFIRIDI